MRENLGLRIFSLVQGQLEKEKKMGEGMRMSARNVLKDKIRRKENELNALEILDNIIDWGDLNKEDEEKLWNYFCQN